MQMQIFGQNPRTDVDEILGIRTSLVTMHAAWMGQTESMEFMMSQSPGTKRDVCIHMPVWHTSIKQHKYL